MLQTNEIIHDGGNHYRVTIEHDDLAQAPWVAYEGHGPVTDWLSRTKAPGERLLSTSGTQHRYYNVQEAVEIAKRDGWNTPPYEVSGESAAERAVRAVDADYRYLRNWCLDAWEYLEISVQLVAEDGRNMEADHPTIETYNSTGCVESLDDDLVEQTAIGLAKELSENLREAALVYHPAHWEPI